MDEEERLKTRNELIKLYAPQVYAAWHARHPFGAMPSAETLAALAACLADAVLKEMEKK